ncbi:MAG: type II secretion system GspH family protein [Verrucomicrobia bacterium]|nr:type II secretion system GspH family protein [Verrucomicrobiota bacterium]
MLCGRNRRGFTLIELLTVLAIIGVLATLLMTALAGAKKQSRQARCTANLHQIALAIGMYLDDRGSRPPDLPVLVTARYLPASAALLCPEDKTGDWGGLHNFPASVASMAQAIGGQTATNQNLGYSYLHPLSWDDASWQRLVTAGPEAGLAVCQLHGLAKNAAPGVNGFPTDVRDFEGLILRAQFDGAVVRRQWFWPSAAAAQSAAVAFSATPGGVGTALTPAPPATAADADMWPLFADVPPPQ